MLRTRLGQRLHRRWVRDRDVAIADGVGRGLMFNAASGNSDYAFGTNEMPVQQELKRLLDPGTVFFDIGANKGFFTIIGAHLVGTSGRILAFEPVPENVSCIRHNAALNRFDQIEVMATAISDVIGMAELQLAEHAGGAALSTAAAPPDMTGLMTVPVITIDSLVARRATPVPNVVKIDVEGAEINVMRGMRQTLQQSRPAVIYEIDDDDRAIFEEKQLACGAYITSMGYEVRRLDDSYPENDWYVAHFSATPK